ncbi:hypothetical protein [Solibacillus isronensis]|uniref:hypothetical protein n=1 Tax=Solibacillus isronensis TaxID=412383 RepID=UPI00203DB20B|nr:hypothetical protein [Solibacillus isronensis]MCM3721196.1 hypothetical protein [Solibacillus isronensis]
MIKNEQFWQHWRAGEFEKALNCSLGQKPKKKGALLRGISETNAITGISAGEFLYDYLMIDPTVVKGIDFARAEDLSHLFHLSKFSNTIDTTVATGDMAQLQGYVAEQMIAQQLIAVGHDVSFPETSNQPGWDLLVDGQPFQVKCGQDKQIVETHLEKYPDTPVIVNEELGAYYTDNPLVMTSSVSREQVLVDTQKTLQHAEELLDFQIPWIAAGVSTYTNAKRMRKDGITLKTVTRNVVTDTVSRTALAATGKLALGAVGSVLLPGAGAIIFPVVGAYVGVAQGGNLARLIKRQFARSEEKTFCLSLHALIDKMQHMLAVKEGIKNDKWQLLVGMLPNPTQSPLDKEHERRLKLLSNVKMELTSIKKTVDENPLHAFERIVQVLGKVGIHAFTLRKELSEVEQAMVAYGKKI